MRANMPRTGDRHVNKKPFRIAINLRESARFYPLDLQKIAKKDAPGPAVHRPKTLQNPQGFSRFGRPKSAPIVHRKHAGTVPVPHRCRAASADTAAMLFWASLASAGSRRARAHPAEGGPKKRNHGLPLFIWSATEPTTGSSITSSTRRAGYRGDPDREFSRDVW